MRFGIQHGATKFNWCLESNNIEIARLGTQCGAADFNICLDSDNPEVILYGLKLLNKI